MTSISHVLPIELMNYITQFADKKDQLAISQTCKDLYLNVRGIKIWELSSLVFRRFTEGRDESLTKSLPAIKADINSFIHITSKTAYLPLTLLTSKAPLNVIEEPLYRDAFKTDIINFVFQCSFFSSLPFIRQNSFSYYEYYLSELSINAYPAVPVSADLPTDVSLGIGMPSVLNLIEKLPLQYVHKYAQFVFIIGTVGTMVALSRSFGIDQPFFHDWTVITGIIGLSEKYVLPKVVECVSNKYPLETRKVVSCAAGAFKALGGAMEWVHDFGIKRAERALNEGILTPVCNQITKLLP